MSEKTGQENIFVEELQAKDIELQNKEITEPENLPIISYLKKGDSINYIGQFLESEVKVEPKVLEPAAEKIIVQDVKGEGLPSSQHQEPSNAFEDQARITPSAFHNFQKHLTVSLKNVIEIPQQEKCVRTYQIAASKLWKIFKNSTVSTKKILHFLLGEKNEHKVTDEALRQYGFVKLYEQYGQKAINEAKKYLGRETLLQIKSQKFQKYIEIRKIKDKAKFKKYVEIFIQELQKGFLRKRLPKEKVAELLA